MLAGVFVNHRHHEHPITVRARSLNMCFCVLIELLIYRFGTLPLLGTRDSDTHFGAAVVSLCRRCRALVRLVCSCGCVSGEPF